MLNKFLMIISIFLIASCDSSDSEFYGNIDIKSDLKTYKITAEKKLKSLKPKKVKQKFDIAKYYTMNYNEIKEDDWKNLLNHLKSL